MFRIMVCCLAVVVPATVGCVAAPENGASSGQAIVLVNAAGIDTGMMTQIRDYAERQLHVPVRVRTMKLPALPTLKHCAAQASERRTKRDAALVVLVAAPEREMLHAAVERQVGVAVVNVTALRAKDDAVTLKRLTRHVMRGAGFLFGLKPAPDPFCVTRHYRTLDDLDKMGMNFCPPWQARFRAEAERRGLHIIPPPRPVMKTP